MVLNLHLHNQQKVLNCSCHMLGGGLFVKFIDSKNAEPFGISEGTKALLEKEIAWTVGFYQVCALPQPLVPFKPWGLVKGTWFSPAPGRAFPWENVIVLADTDSKTSPLLTQCCRLSACQVQTTQIWCHSFSISVWGPSISKGNHAQEVF